jgi:nicotinamidase-related amidase
MRILTEHTIGLVIDIQERLLPHIHEHKQLLRNTEILLEGLRVLEVPILVTEQYRKGLGKTVDEVRGKLLKFEPLEKMTFSCCDDIQFMRELKEVKRGTGANSTRGKSQHSSIGKKADPKNILICGIETHVCVLQTTIDLLKKGYKPLVIEDCTSSRKANDKKIAIERMRQEGAVITSYESILFELTRVSGNDKFKAISNLVK